MFLKPDTGVPHGLLEAFASVHVVMDHVFQHDEFLFGTNSAFSSRTLPMYQREERWSAPALSGPPFGT